MRYYNQTKEYCTPENPNPKVELLLSDFIMLAENCLVPYTDTDKIMKYVLTQLKEKQDAMSNTSSK